MFPEVSTLKMKPELGTVSGQMISLLDPQPEDIRLADIVAGLAHTCRFGGQLTGFLSVAQHSVIVSDALLQWQPCARELAMAGLFHDAAEAYIGDIPTPLKQLLPDFDVLEQRMMDAVAARFGIERALFRDERLLAVDHQACITEARQLCACPWPHENPMPSLPVAITPWNPQAAAYTFLCTVSALGGRRFEEDVRQALATLRTIGFAI